MENFFPLFVEEKKINIFQWQIFHQFVHEKEKTTKIVI